MVEEHTQRRLAAILAADVAGYSRLMSIDEFGVLNAFRSHLTEFIEPKLAEYNGRLFKTMGDGLLVEFASVVEAVQCAVAIQEGMVERNLGAHEDNRIEFRIGINLGDVIAQNDDVFGDGVNVAARIEGLAEPGGICISRAARDQIRDKLEYGLEDWGEIEVKNIPRAVHVFRVLPELQGSGKAIARPPNTKGRLRFQFAAAVLVLITAAAGVAWWQMRTPLSTGMDSVDGIARHQIDKPFLAVLPFANLTGTEGQDYFVDGLTSDIISALGRYESLAVMTFNAALPYKGKAVNSTEVGRALSVRYLVEGDVRRSGKRVRVNARLTDAERGILLWSEQFDQENNDVFALQDTITRLIAGTLITNVKLVEQKRAFAKPTSNLDAYDLVLQGRSQLLKSTRVGNKEARRLFKKAIDLDDKYASAYAWLARAHYQMVATGWTEFSADALAQAKNLSQKAIEIEPRNVEGHRTLGRVHSIQFRIDRAISEIEQAIKLNPSHAEAHADKGVILLWASRPTEAESSLNTAFTFDPNLRADYVFAHGLALYTLRQHKQAVHVLERGAARTPKFISIPAVLVAAYGQLEKHTDAQRNVDKVHKLFPFFNAARFGSRFSNPQLHQYLTEGLRKGGLL